MTAVLAGIVTGLFTLAAALATLFLRGRQERAAAQDERLWNRRAETYVDLLQYQGSGMIMIEGFYGPETATAREWAIRDELTAKAAAFASDVVRELWQQSALASLALEGYVDDAWPEWTTTGAKRFGLEEEMEEDPEFRRLRQASVEAGKRLAEQIRGELDVKSPGRFRRRRQGR